MKEQRDRAKLRTMFAGITRGIKEIAKTKSVGMRQPTAEERERSRSFKPSAAYFTPEAKAKRAANEAMRAGKEARSGQDRYGFRPL